MAAAITRRNIDTHRIGLRRHRIDAIVGTRRFNPQVAVARLEQRRAEHRRRLLAGATGNATERR
jgi:hypothetical protein